MSDEAQWTIKKEISLGDVVAVVTAIGAVLISYMHLNARVMVIETVTQQNSVQIAGTISEIKTELRRLNDRLEQAYLINTNGHK